MLKYFILLLVLVSALFSKTINFSEEKYIEALGKTFNKKGKITFSKESIEILYHNDNSLLIYSGDTLVSKKGNKIKTLDLKEKPSVKMFFLLFEAIYFEKKSIFKTYFHQQKKDGMVLLLPNENIKRYIREVKYRKKAGMLIFLEINMTNNDRIYIEETH